MHGKSVLQRVLFSYKSRFTYSFSLSNQTFLREVNQFIDIEKLCKYYSRNVYQKKKKYARFFLQVISN